MKPARILKPELNKHWPGTLIRDGSKKNWFKQWFGQEYTEVYAHRDEQDARDLVHLIIKHIPISRKSRILDAACGNGRHACALTEYSEQVFGVDLSVFLLQQARQNCHFKIVCGDLRALPFKQTFDVVLSLFTSFGYFFSDEENFEVLLQFNKILRAGGYLFFDYLNAPYVRRHLKPRTERKAGGKTITEQREITGNRVEKTIVISENNSLKKFYESVRLYEPSELLSLLNKAGFEVLKQMGDYQGRSFQQASSPRFIVLARKR